MPKIGKTLSPTTRDEWRAWLEENHDTETEIWLILYKKRARESSLSYDDAVEEALCFGWIDGILKKIDEEKHALRYSPRRKRSIWSALNKDRAERMISEGRMTQAGLAKISQAKENGQCDSPFSLEEGPAMPSDLKEALKTNEKARANFEGFSPSAQKQYFWWIENAKRVETRKRRVEETVCRAEQNKKPGIQ